MKLAVVGVTGLVGTKMVRILEERNFQVDELLAVASEQSVGKEIRFRGQKLEVISMQEAIDRKPGIALFSAGGNTSLQWAPEFASVGTTVIDNSSAWRMDPDVPLVVPEINAGVLRGDHRIIANPNCSTIQMVVALAPLYQAYGIERIVVSTYQSVTGTGVKAVRQLEGEELSAPEAEIERAYPHSIHRNCLPHCDVFLDNGYTKEEMKLVNETRKIFGDQNIRITATAVRVPVTGGHSEAVNVELKKDFTLEEVRRLLSDAPGIILEDDPAHEKYPMPVNAHGHDEVFVGRIRRDESCDHCLNLWIVADNLRKGAATNAIQIAEYLTRNR